MNDVVAIGGGLIALYVCGPLIILGLCIWCCWCCCCRDRNQTIIVPGGGGGPSINNVIIPPAQNLYSPGPQYPSFPQSQAPAYQTLIDSRAEKSAQSAPQPGLNPPPYTS